jgi:beta-galactosidase
MWRNAAQTILFLSIMSVFLVAIPVAGQAAYGELPPSLEFRDANADLPVAWQSGSPVPSFEPQDRPRLDLAGEWLKERVFVDSNLSLAPRDESGIAAIEVESEGRYLADYDDSAWETKMLPMVENRMPTLAGSSAGPEPYEAGVWYRRTLIVDESWQGTRVSLNFLSVNYIVDIWVNGEWVGYHEGGYTPFAFDVSDYLNYGAENTIALRIDNPLWGSRVDTVPAVKPDWWNYTGVIQDFYLESTPKLYIVRADVLSPDLSGRVQTRILVHNASTESQTASLNLQIYGTDPGSEAWLNDPHASAIVNAPVGEAVSANLTIEAGEVQVLSAELMIPDVALWSPASPNLYVLAASLSEDRFMTQFGVRTIRTEGYQLLLNEQPYFLAGIARHEEWPDSGRTATWEKIRTDLEIIRGLGANFIRTAHYPNHIYSYLLTDRLGLTAAVEVPMWQATEVEYQAQAERQIAEQLWREMILSNRNRPSIIMWSSNNESREIAFRTEYIQRLQNDFETNYPDGRLIMQSAAADRTGASDTSQDSLDIAAWTMYFGIFHGSTYYEGTRDFLREVHEVYPNRPILNTEFGIWSRGAGSNEANQVLVFEETFRALTEVSAWDAQGQYNPDGYLAGIVWWTGFDWYTAHTNLQTMGIYNMNRERPKQLTEVLREAYSVWSLFISQ